MELAITPTLEEMKLPRVTWNNEELKQLVSQKAAEYSAIVYTDEREKEMKKDLATLRKFMSAIEDERKRVKAFYLDPYEQFESEVKEVLQPMKDTISLIDEGVKEIAAKWKEDQRQLVINSYNANVGDLKEPLEAAGKVETIISNDALYKKSMTAKKIDAYMVEGFSKIRSDLAALDVMPEKIKDKAILKYMENFSLSEAMKEGQRLEELEKVLEERKKRQEEEAARAAEEARKAAEMAANRPTEPETIAPEEVSQEAPEEPKVVSDPDVEMIFRVKTSKAKLLMLRDFMNSNNIHFERA